MKKKIAIVALILGIVIVFGIVCCNVVMGKFYTLQEAYDNGWLTQADLMSIAYYHNGGRTHNEEIMDDDYEPTPKSPEVLSKWTESRIKMAAAKEYRGREYNIKYARARGFTITEYCGTYGDCVAVMMQDEYTGGPGIVRTDVVAGVKVYYSSGRTIKVWKGI